MCEYVAVYIYIYIYIHTHTHTHTHTDMPYIVYSFVFAIIPSVKTFVSRLQQTPNNVSEQSRIWRKVEFADVHKPLGLVLSGW